MVPIGAALHARGPERDADSALRPFLWFCFMSETRAVLGSASEERGGKKTFLDLGLGSALCLMLWQRAGSLQSELCSRLWARSAALKSPGFPAVPKPSDLVAV